MLSRGGSSGEHPSGVVEQAKAPAPEGPPASDYDEWEMEERLRHLDRIYARSPLAGPLSRSATSQFRVDLQHTSLPRELFTSQYPAEPSPGWTTRLARLLLGMGLSVTVCGGCLMAWAHYGTRPDLMPLGIPIAVVGQVLLLVGLVLQFDSPGTEKKRDAEGGDFRTSSRADGRSKIRLENQSDNTLLLKDFALRLDEISKKLEGQSN